MRRTRRPRKRPNTEGFTLLEVTIASTVMLLSSLALATVFSSFGLSSRTSDRAVSVQATFETTQAGLEGIPFHELLSLDGTSIDRGDHVVRIRARTLEVGLVLVECLAEDAHDGHLLARLATYRSEEG